MSFKTFYYHLPAVEKCLDKSLLNCMPYCKCYSNSEWLAVFSMWKFALIWSLLSLPVARLSHMFICATCLFQSRCSSIKTSRCLTEWVHTSLLPSNLNLKLWSIFSFCGLKITSFVFFMLRLSLFALNQFERFGYLFW